MGTVRRDAPYDWDKLYFIGRYRLQFSDDEFWECTPRKFWKIYEMMNGNTKTAEKQNNDKLPSLADFGI